MFCSTCRSSRSLASRTHGLSKISSRIYFDLQMCWFCLKSWPWDCKRSRSCDFVTWCCEGFVTLPKIWLQNNQGSYKRCFAYGNGKLCNGLICHSCWLTTANRFLRLWVSQHWETGENLYRLREIIKFIVCVYYPMWFMITTRCSRTQGPHPKIIQLFMSSPYPAAAQACEENEPKRPGPNWKIHNVQCLEFPLRENHAISPCWLYGS